MTVLERAEHRNWAGFLSTATVSLLIWDGFIGFTFDPLTFTSSVWLSLVLLFPFVGLLLSAHYFVWRTDSRVGSIGLSVLASLLLVIGVAKLVGTMQAMIYPVHVYGIP